MIGLRQNMTPLVAEGRINPYGRHWWGGVPEGWSEEARTVRSGLCLTRERYLAYFYSPSVDPDRLARAMVAARCHYGIHLDMNAGHAGFEFYRVETTAELPSLGRELDPMWEARGTVPGVDGHSFLARLMVRKMPLMNFPRYVHQTPRDFFYLTRRDVLPHRPLSIASGQFAFGIVDLPGNDYPPFVSATEIGEGDSLTARVTRLDAKQLSASGTPQAQVLSFGSVKGPSRRPASQSEDEPGEGLYLRANRFSIGPPPTDGESSVLLLESSIGEVEYCVDAFGFLNIIEPSRDTSHELVAQIKAALDCKQSMKGGRGQLSLDGTESTPGGVALYRKAEPWAREIFSTTPIVPQKEWGIPQARRAPLVQ